MNKSAVIAVLILIFVGFQEKGQAQGVITSDSMEAQLRNIPEGIFKKIKNQEESLSIKTKNTKSQLYTIPAASEDNIINLTLANATSRNISNISVEVEEMPEWLQMKTKREGIENLTAGDVIELSYKFDLAAEIPSEKKADITFTITGSDGFSGQKTIQVVSGEPLNFKLNQNYPNPFNPSTNISYRLPEQMQVKVTIYNILGRKVAVLVDKLQKAGVQTLKWDASSYASGVYFYRIIAESKSGERFMRHKKMLLVK